MSVIVCGVEKVPAVSKRDRAAVADSRDRLPQGAITTVGIAGDDDAIAASDSDVEGGRSNRAARAVRDREREAVGKGRATVVRISDQVVVDVGLGKRPAGRQNDAPFFRVPLAGAVPIV